MDFKESHIPSRVLAVSRNHAFQRFAEEEDSNPEYFNYTYTYVTGTRVRILLIGMYMFIYLVIFLPFLFYIYNIMRIYILQSIKMIIELTQ